MTKHDPNNNGPQTSPNPSPRPRKLVVDRSRAQHGLTRRSDAPGILAADVHVALDEGGIGAVANCRTLMQRADRAPQVAVALTALCPCARNTLAAALLVWTPHRDESGQAYWHGLDATVFVPVEGAWWEIDYQVAWFIDRADQLMYRVRTPEVIRGTSDALVETDTNLGVWAPSAMFSGFDDSTTGERLFRAPAEVQTANTTTHELIVAFGSVLTGALRARGSSLLSAITLW